jgi:hypothetical protein
VIGFSYVAGNTGHAAIPLGGSYVTKKGDLSASLMRDSDYPIVAECKVCHGRIRLGQVLQMEWQHAPVTAVTSGDAS